MSIEKHGQRFEDLGFGRILKYWHLIVLLFAIGGWYESTRANALLVEKSSTEIEELKTRTTRVEDAVVYLTQIVKDDRRHRYQ